MSERLEARAVAFDPYGEPLDAGRESAPSPGDRRARSVAVAVFWTLALTLVAGRIYVDPAPVTQTVAAVRMHLAALVATP
ncbi:hypothetical protein [Methylobacterium sp. ID0610]|uniref:hypothetical protein n=1 Tax=Methylobacterium carpenticola TaxID=3344827 RepID=UPI0036768F9D